MPRPPNWLPNRYPEDHPFKQIARITRRKLQENPTKLFPKYGGTRRGTSHEDRAYHWGCCHHAVWIGDTGRRFGKPHARKVPASAWLSPWRLRRWSYARRAHIIPQEPRRRQSGASLGTARVSFENVRRHQSQALQKPSPPQPYSKPTFWGAGSSPAGYTSTRVFSSRQSRYCEQTARC
jgi:hypothetical protein